MAKRINNTQNKLKEKWFVTFTLFVCKSTLVNTSGFKDYRELKSPWGG